MATRYALDIATCSITGAEDWLPAVKARGNLKDPDKIQADLADKRASQLETLALDPDLCRISALGVADVSGWGTPAIGVWLAKTESDERALLTQWAGSLRDADTITYNGLAFDLVILERRMLYLGLPSLRWNLDKYRQSNHVDLLAKLSGGDKDRRRALTFYTKRLGWNDFVKPLSGADEALAPGRGQWFELSESVRHDVGAVIRLAQWMGVLPVVVTE